MGQKLNFQLIYGTKYERAEGLAPDDAL